MARPLDGDAERILAVAGVRRLADLSLLDDLGLHVVAAIRTPRSSDSISVCAGRGATHDEARIGAIAEALERRCAEPDPRLPSRSALDPGDDRLEIASLVPTHVPAADDRIDWICGRRIRGGDRIWLPLDAVVFPVAHARWFAPLTHGLAAGPTLAAATATALLECIERDAYTRAVALATLGAGARCPPIDAATLAAPARALESHLRARGLVVLLRDITGGTGVPSVLATIAEDRGDHAWAHRGCAADPDPQRAARRALEEAVQGRLVDIQGAREDLPSERVTPDRWFFDARPQPYAPLPAQIDVDLASLAGRLVGDGCGEPVVVDLSIPGVAWRVVRVVVPGLEVWADDATRVGARLEAWCRAA